MLGFAKQRLKARTMASNISEDLAPDTEPARRIWQVVAQIPKGKVATYGQIAKLAGLGRGARQVGAVLKKLPRDSKLPWYRVVNSQGKISLPAGPSYDRQVKRLADEQVTLINGRIRLSVYQWDVL